MDSIDLNTISNSSNPQFEFDLSARPLLKQYQASFNFDKRNSALSAIIHGELDFAMTRMAYNWTSPSNLRKKLNEFKDDIRGHLASWESSRDFRKAISGHQKTGPTSYAY